MLKRLKKTQPIHVEENRDSIVYKLLALHKPVSGKQFLTVMEVNIHYFHQNWGK